LLVTSLEKIFAANRWKEGANELTLKWPAVWMKVGRGFPEGMMGRSLAWVLAWVWIGLKRKERDKTNEKHLTPW
jgi:hypothetical protein